MPVSKRLVHSLLKNCPVSYIFIRMAHALVKVLVHCSLFKGMPSFRELKGRGEVNLRFFFTKRAALKVTQLVIHASHGSLKPCIIVLL